VGRKTVLVAVILAAVLAWFGLGLDQHLTFEAIRDRQEDLQRYYQTEPFTLLGLYFVAYIIMAALSLPGAALLTLCGIMKPDISLPTSTQRQWGATSALW